jgi:AraC-like DNA-binding protein
MNWSLTEFLNHLELRGQTWCIVEIGESGGFSVPPNDGVLFYAVLQGSARIAGISGGTIQLGHGHVSMILSGEAHAVRNQPDSPARTLDFLREDQDIDVPPVISIGDGPVTSRILCGRMNVSWPNGLRRVSMPPVVRVGNDSFRPMTDAIRAEGLSINATGAGAAALLTRTASLILAIGLRSHPQCPLLFRMSATTDPIAHALQMIGSDPSADWTVAKLAQKVSMGRSNFAARFMAKVGRTPMDVITERRMHHAAALLQESDLKICEISMRAGYRSEAAFSRRFTRFFGVPPGQMRHASSKDREESAGARWSGVPGQVAGAC